MDVNIKLPLVNGTSLRLKMKMVNVGTTCFNIRKSVFCPQNALVGFV
jgi:hypothetical protein